VFSIGIASSVAMRTSEVKTAVILLYGHSFFLKKCSNRASTKWKWEAFPLEPSCSVTYCGGFSVRMFPKRHHLCSIHFCEFYTVE
jgi:hypothetical protein